MYNKVYVEITNICNMNCSFCHGHSRKPGMMSEENFARILSQLSEKTKYIYYHLMGEPLLHPDLPRFITMAKQAGFKQVIIAETGCMISLHSGRNAIGIHFISESQV